MAPPATSTLPERSNVAVCKARALRLPVPLQVPVAGSYSSALLKEPSLYPPATNTLPDGRSVAVCQKRASPMWPVAVQVPLAGVLRLTSASSSSALFWFGLSARAVGENAKHANASGIRSKVPGKGLRRIAFVNRGVVLTNES